MTRQRRRWLLMAILLVLTCWQAIACQPVSPPVRQSDCYRVNHAAGQTCVPEKLERLVTLDSASFENAIALGLHPIATVTTDVSQHLLGLQTEAKNIGNAGEPNLESILALKPDLILGLDYHRDIYTKLEKIAPTVLLKFDHSGLWKQVFQAFSQVLNREAISEQVMTKYKLRLQDFKRRLAAPTTTEKLSLPQISVVRIYPHSINLYLRDSFVGTILQDAGLPRPPAQDLSAQQAVKIANNPVQISISRELLSQADGDALFLWMGEDTASAQEEARQKLEALQTDPLWRQLNAVQQNKVYQVPNYWIGWGPISANAVVDDLFKYLIPQVQA